MEKYSLTFSKDGRIDCVCNRGEIGCPCLDFTDTQSLIEFLKERIISFDEFTFDQEGINITWHEKNDGAHILRSAKLSLDPYLWAIIDADICNIHQKYRRHREALDFLKARCREELRKGNYLYDNDVLLSYCEYTLKVYLDYGKTDTLYDKESDKLFLDFLKNNREKFIDCKYKKISEEENEINKKDMKINAFTGGINGALIALLIHSPLYLIIAVLGVSITSAICQEHFNKSRNIEIKACKDIISVYDELTDSLDENIKAGIDKSSYEHEEFYNFIKQDIDYMNAHSSEDYADLLVQIEKLQTAYTKDVLERRNIDIYHYLLALAYLEIDIYSKETGVGLKSEYVCPLNRETIIQRLRLMGFNDLMSSNEDVHLKTLLESVDRIIDTPFIGCEAEVARLNRIAIDYAEEALKHLCQESDFDVTKIDAVIEESHDEASFIANKLQIARKYDELCSLMDDLNAHLAVDPNMHLEQGMTLPQ